MGRGKRRDHGGEERNRKRELERERRDHGGEGGTGNGRERGGERERVGRIEIDRRKR